MKLAQKILVSSFAAAMAFSGAAFASAPGFYAGVQAGWSNLSNTPNMPGVSVDTKGAAFGLRAGYQFDQNWAVEAGYTRLAKAKFTYPGVGSASMNLNVFDVVGKGTYGFDNGFGIYAKAGVAHVRTSASGNIDGDNYNLGSNSATRPVAGVGVKYDFNQNVSVDVGVTRIFKGGKMDFNADTVMAGVTYNFG
jgi:opacity protein-like surface antigen